MPLYEYKCEGCGATFDVIEKFSDQPLAVHDKCGGKVHRVLTAPSFHFKGSGWYVTDYAKGGNGPNKSDSANDGGKSESKAESKSESKAESKSESKTESKSEAKSESKSKSESKAEKPAPASSTPKSD